METIYFGGLLLATTLNLSGIYMENSISRIIGKALIVPSLILLYYERTKEGNKTKSKRNKDILSGLFLGYCGDMALLFPEKPIIFEIGVLCFLVGHIFYLKVMYNRISSFKHYVPLVLITIGQLSVYLTYIYFFFLDKIEKLIIKIGIIYGFFLSFFIIVSIYNYAINQIKSNLLLMIGSLFFYVSDTALTLTLFCFDFPYSGILIMVTYILAQTLISYAMTIN